MAGILAVGVAGCGGGSDGGGPGSVDFTKAKAAAETNPEIAKRAARFGGGPGGAPNRGAQ